MIGTVEPPRAPPRGDEIIDLRADPRSFTVPAPITVPSAEPDAAEPVEPEERPRRRRRWWTKVVGVLAVVVISLAAVAGAYVWRTYRKLDRIPVAQVLTPEGGTGTNYLIVGTDSREGLDADTANADLVIGDGVAGSRSDTIVLMRMSASGNLMLPIPRDLYLPIADTKGSNRINTAIQGGPARLIQTVQQSLGLPVNHYVEIDFAGFLDLVDAVGGVTIDFDAPAFDSKSGLDIKAAGPQKLDKDMALAYVRSRTYTRVVNGKEVVDPRGDLGRIERQQTFLHAVMDQVGSVRNPLTLAHVGDAVAEHLRVDDTIGFRDALGLARRLSNLNPETVDLATKPTRTKSGAAVLLLSQPKADEALARFR
ncbi:MAG TPA: LCP family protein [Acidimicrobiales bacterium]|nr:LCP family protein [Acidimicrobiales bacterium]